MSASFSHLSAHSHYSLLDAIPQIDPLVKAASYFGMPSLALTDKNNLYGAIEFYKSCKKENVKPIIGVDVDISMFGIEEHVILLAESIDGYKNLLKIVSKMQLASPGSPRLKTEHLDAHGAGLIALIPDTALGAPGAGELAEYLTAHLGRGNVFARLGWNASGGESGRERQIRTAGLAKALALPLAAADDTYYLKPEDRDVRDIVRKIANPDAIPDDGDRTFISIETAEERYRDFPEALKNTEEIAARATVELELGKWVFANFPIPEGTTYQAELEKLARSGIKKRGLDDSPELEKRLTYELSVIETKGFAPYFLIVSDLLTHAKEAGILTTTRGSAAGSLVSYLTSITNINPLEYKLPFERFLNPERPSAPDIDMDFADTRRDDMIRYARERYGENSVAQIGTFGTMMARAAVRDVARAMGYSYGVGDRIAKMIPFGSQGFPMTIDRALEMEEDLKKFYQSDEDAELIIDAAKRIEGNARHISIHAAGIVIAPGDVTDFVPVQMDPHGTSVITEYDMHGVEDAGLLKFDFLGLKNLSILGDAVERVHERLGETIDIENIPLNDEKVFAMLSRGDTEGVFQLGGSGMTHYLKELHPSSIDDINAMVALYRPGPMESIPQYIARKHNPALVTYPEPRLKEILGRSYGIVTYQDDVLLIAITLAGYTWLEADQLRKAMGKKIPAEMEKQKEKFIAGCEKHAGLTRGKAESIWKLIEPFAAYGFNKGHAASYGKVAYQTAYMKAHFPEDYMAALLTADSGDTERVAEHVAECAKIGIQVLPPDVNESFVNFTVVAAGIIRFGLSTIKNFGAGAAEAIIEERKKNGPFQGMADFLARVPGSVVNKRGLESLIKCGVFDAFAERGILLSNLEKLSAFAKEAGAAAAPEHQDSLFGASSAASAPAAIQLEPGTPASRDEALAWEKDLLGIYVSGHPLDRFKDSLAQYQHSIANARAEERAGYPLIVAGVVEVVKTILTKKGDRMGFITLADKEASIESVAFPEAFKSARDALTEGKCVLVKGKLSKRNGEPSIVIEKVKGL
ncbi:MAG: DNA polymerase III subunit alpha [Patescibacteria group bacterium]|nr:DNA polymerase III subunit alpha [Patescibacteria group bacterium]